MTYLSSQHQTDTVALVLLSIWGVYWAEALLLMVCKVVEQEVDAGHTEGLESREVYQIVSLAFNGGRSFAG